jgi:hypothetical protein
VRTTGQATQTGVEEAGKQRTLGEDREMTQIRLISGSGEITVTPRAAYRAFRRGGSVPARARRITLDLLAGRSTAYAVWRGYGVAGTEAIGEVWTD